MFEYYQELLNIIKSKGFSGPSFTSGVYQIRCKVTGKRYIGSTVNFERRWGKGGSSHLYRLRKGTHHSPHLQNAWNKYGEKEFLFEPLIQITKFKPCLLAIEQIVMDGLNTHNSEFGYNNATSCQSPNKGKKISEATRERLKDSHTGKTWIMVFQGETSKQIDSKDLDYYLSLGYQRGIPLSRREEISTIVTGSWKKSPLIWCYNPLTLEQKRLRELPLGWLEGRGTQLGLVWVQRDGKGLKIQPSDLVDYLKSGWVKGKPTTYNNKPLTPEQKNNLSQKNSGKIFVNNGSISKCVLPTEIPEGFTLGRLPINYNTLVPDSLEDPQS